MLTARSGATVNSSAVPFARGLLHRSRLEVQTRFFKAGNCLHGIGWEGKYLWVIQPERLLHMIRKPAIWGKINWPTMTRSPMA